jgi:hypothetical protein
VCPYIKCSVINTDRQIKTFQSNTEITDHRYFPIRKSIFTGHFSEVFKMLHRTVLGCPIISSPAIKQRRSIILCLSPVSYGPPWAHYLGGCQDRLLGGPLGLPNLRCTAPAGVKHKDYGGEVLG